ncbi:hypothetical protein [Streptomyces sp. NPDC018610]|uniref:hypothetical protein n=1 Tax=Streptomyces sp. NPDC018610 TaxID=3365049 RepID=UPI0037A61362
MPGPERGARDQHGERQLHRAGEPGPAAHEQDPGRRGRQRQGAVQRHRDQVARRRPGGSAARSLHPAQPPHGEHDDDQQPGRHVRHQDEQQQKPTGDRDRGRGT